MKGGYGKVTSGKSEKVMMAKAHNMGGGKAGTFPNAGSKGARAKTNIKFNRKG